MQVVSPLQTELTGTLTEKEVTNSSPVLALLAVEWVELEVEPKNPYWEPFDRDDRLK